MPLTAAERALISLGEAAVVDSYEAAVQEEELATRDANEKRLFLEVARAEVSLSVYSSLSNLFNFVQFAQPLPFPIWVFLKSRGGSGLFTEFVSPCLLSPMLSPT